MEFELMEGLLRIEAEVKYFLGATDRSYEQSLMDELLNMVEEAELLLGPRDRSYELLTPRITECGYGHPFIYPFRKIRIYLTSHSKDRSTALHQLAHETVHVLGPTQTQSTVLEEGLAEYFSHQYLKRVYGLQAQSPNRKYEAAKNAVSPLMAKNEFVIKELRIQQPQISKIDARLLVEVAGIEPDQAMFLCTDFRSYGRTNPSWSDFAAQGYEHVVNGFRAIWK